MARALFRVLSSVTLAVLLLLAVAAVVAAATFREHGIDPAAGSLRRDWYGSLWFSSLLGLLGLNVLCGTIKRARFGLPHLGFLINHAGVLLVLLGAFLSFRFKTQGRLELAEGGRAGEIELEGEHELVADDGRAVLPIRETRVAPVQIAATLDSAGTSVRVLRLLPHATLSESWENDGTVEQRIALVRSGGRTLAVPEGAAESPEGAPLALFYRRQSDAEYESLLRSAGPLGTLRLTVDGETKDFDVRDAAGKSLPIGQRILTIRPLAVGTTLVRFDLASGGRTQSFAIAPERPALLHPPGDFEAVLRVPLRLDALLLLRSGERLRYLRTTAEGTTRGGDVAPGGTIDGIEVVALLDRARLHTRAQEEPPKDRETLRPALEVSIQGAEPQWLALSRAGKGRRDFLDAGRRIALEYRPRRHPLPFDVRLEKFRKPLHPGTQEAASFESDLELQERGAGDAHRRTLRVNEPLRFLGFLFYQASFDDRVSPVVSILQVSRDPGKPVVYAGAAITVLGMLYMFYLKPVLLRRTPAA